MGIKKLTVVLTDGAVSGGTITESSIMESALDVLAMPFGMTAADEEYISKKGAAYGAMSWGIGLGLLGEALGHKRERQGSKSFVPVWRG